MRLVLFVGPKGCGKDSAASMLYQAKKSRSKISFAGPLKEICAKVFRYPAKFMNDPILKEKPFETIEILDRTKLRLIKQELPKYVPELDPVTGLLKYNIDRVTVSGLENRQFTKPREILQQVGTDFIRNLVYPNWHVEAAFSPERVTKYRKGELYCVTDTRFLNEYKFLLKNYGDSLKVYYIERPEAEAHLAEATHESELEVLKIKELLPKECIIKNDGSLEDFKKKVLKLDLPPRSGKKAASAKKTGFIYGTRNR